MPLPRWQAFLHVLFSSMRLCCIGQWHCHVIHTLATCGKIICHRLLPCCPPSFLLLSVVLKLSFALPFLPFSTLLHPIVFPFLFTTYVDVTRTPMSVKRPACHTQMDTHQLQPIKHVICNHNCLPCGNTLLHPHVCAQKHTCSYIHLSILYTLMAMTDLQMSSWLTLCGHQGCQTRSLHMGVLLFDTTNNPSMLRTKCTWHA